MGGSISTSSHGRYSGGYPVQPKPNPRARKHPMDIICLGLPRTGSLSLCTALRQIGFHKPYHFQTLYLQKRDDAIRWRKLLNYKFHPSQNGRVMRREDFDDILFESMAISDIPGLIFHEELLRCYPDAKVILTIRDNPEEWAESFRETITQSFKETFEPRSFGSRFRQSVFKKNDLEVVCMEIQQRFLDEIEKNPVKFYEEWNRQIMRRVPPNRLLVYNVNQGWDPLVRFLGVNVAHRIGDSPFPHVNARESFPKAFLPDQASISDAASTLTANSVGVSSLASESTLVGSTGTRRHVLRRSLR